MTWINLVLSFTFVYFVPASSAKAETRYVTPSHPNAADEGHGGENSPYKTLGYAMKQLLPGDTLMIAPGEYRDALIFPKRPWTKNRPTTIQGEGHLGVTIVGNELVRGWEAKGQGVYVKRPWILEPQHVSLDGVALTQIGGTIFNGYPGKPGHELEMLHRSQGGIWPTRNSSGRNPLPEDAFFYDGQQKELVIRIKDEIPSERLQVEISMRPYLVQGQGVEGITIKNIRFRYSNTTTTSRQGAVTLVGPGNTLDGLVLEDMDGVGIEVSGDNNIIRNCRVTRSGYLGIKARGRNVLIEDNVVSYNNTRRFNKWWEAGGMKFVGWGGLHASRVRRNQVHHNYGDGIWFDWGNDDNVIEHNVVAYNQGFGIHYEASSRAVIQDNEVFRNSQRGIYLIHSRDSVILHNLVAFNQLEGIAIVDEKRTDPKGILDLRPKSNSVLANVIGWNDELALILPGQEYPSVSDANLYLYDKRSPIFSMGWPKGPFGKISWENWQQEERLDQTSSAVRMAVPSRLMAAIDRGEISVDWSPIDLPRNKMRVASQPLSMAIPYGVLIGNRVGPR
jgi:parallel beta-helix repeat protein